MGAQSCCCSKGRGRQEDGIQILQDAQYGDSDNDLGLSNLWYSREASGIGLLSVYSSIVDGQYAKEERNETWLLFLSRWSPIGT